MKELTKNTKVCLALGYFDSVHLGHRKLIEFAKSYADAHGLSSAVATFTNNAYKVFNRDGKTVYT
ncbi:MAG: adenylyltransferase/cytidyltransferase family protein, partial [Clostridiales bacterium]|nr:adenylyltransferase/cytidyltransferase family protein [Clostridiales bacterium]